MEKKLIVMIVEFSGSSRAVCGKKVCFPGRFENFDNLTEKVVGVMWAPELEL